MISASRPPGSEHRRRPRGGSHLPAQPPAPRERRRSLHRSAPHRSGRFPCCAALKRSARRSRSPRRSARAPHRTRQARSTSRPELFSTRSSRNRVRAPAGWRLPIRRAYPQAPASTQAPHACRRSRGRARPPPGTPRRHGRKLRFPGMPRPASTGSWALPVSVESRNRISPAPG